MTHRPVEGPAHILHRVAQGLGSGRRGLQGHLLGQRGHVSGGPSSQSFLPCVQCVLQGAKVHKVGIQRPTGGVLHQCPLKLPLDQRGVDDRNDAHHRGAEGDWNGDAQDILQNTARAVWHISGQPGLTGPAKAVAEQHIGQGHHSTHRHAGNSAGSGHMGGLPRLNQPVGQGQADDQLAKGLNDLGDGGGGHVAVSLGIPPEGGQTAHAHYGGSQRLDAGGGLGVVHHGGQRIGLEIHH